MKKHVIPVALTLLLTFALLAGCGSAAAAPTASAAPAATDAAVADTAAATDAAAADAAAATDAFAPAAVPAVPDTKGMSSLDYLLSLDDKLPLGGLQPSHLDSREEIYKALDKLEDPGDGSFTIAWASASQGSSFFTEMVSSAKAKCDEYGWKFLNQSAEFDLGTQQTQIENFLTQDIDFLVVNAVEIDAEVEYYRQAVEKGIPVIIVGCTAAQEEYPIVTNIVSGSFEAGYSVGEYVAEKLWGQFPDGLNWGAVISRAGDADSNSRPCGFISGYLHKYAELAGTPYASKWDATVIGYNAWTQCRDQGSASIDGIINLVGYGAAGSTDAASAQPVAADLLTAHPEINLMFSETDSLCPGIYQECIQHERVPGKDILLCCGADGADYTLEKIKSGEYLAVGVNAPYYTGQGVVELIHRILTDSSFDANNLPATSYTPTYCVSAENVDDVWDGEAAFASMLEWNLQTIDEYNAANG